MRFKNFKGPGRNAFVVLSFFIYGRLLAAPELLPYTTRTQPYSLWSSSAQGDLRSVGMAGATNGLANTFIAILDNPAGLAMAVNGTDSNLVSNMINDGAVQSFDNPLRSNYLGIASSVYPWGFAFVYKSRLHEGMEYATPSAPTVALTPKISTEDFYFSVAHVLFSNRLSLGASLLLSQANETLDTTNLSQRASTASTSISFGASWQFPHRLIAGVSYAPALQYEMSPTASTGINQFFQSLKVPFRLGLGVGWIPNRLFRADFTTLLVGATPDAALLKSNTALVGETATLQPRLGVAYQFIDWKELSATINTGSYLEVSRIRGSPDRLHATLSVEFLPWIFAVGIGVDASSNYRNYLFSFGLNFVKVMEKLDLVPHFWRPPYAGLAPDPFHSSDSGLARPLVKHWKPHGPDLDPIEIGLAIPGRIEKKADEIGKGISELFSKGSKIKTKKPKRNTKKKTRKFPHGTQQI